jgi:zinc transporter ZupT
MAPAWVITLLALCGVLLGVLAGQRRLVSAHLSAAAGGLLWGISLFWLMPEIAESAGWLIAACLTALACSLIAILDRMLHAGDAAAQTVIAPLFVATALHSFFDGWSVRMMQSESFTGIAIPFGLALHKIPEGLALGWIARRSIASLPLAIASSAAVESITLLGAVAEPKVNSSGVAVFGIWWTVAVLAVIAGSFLFLGFHAVFPNRRNRGVVWVFVAALVASASASRLL